MFQTQQGVEQAYHYAGASGCGLNGSLGSGQSDATRSPHAVQQVGNQLYTYDSHGNQLFADSPVAGGDRSIQYTANDQAYQITQGKNTTQFWYSPGNQRYKRQDIYYQSNGDIDPPPPTGPASTSEPDASVINEPSFADAFAINEPSLFESAGFSEPMVAAAAPPGTPTITKTITVANLEIITSPTGVVTTRRTVAGVMLQETVNTVSVNRYLFHNHLGSVIRITDAVGSTLESFDYSAFGERRNPTVDYPNGGGSGSERTLRGYTGHEMLDSFGIVHMNGNPPIFSSD